MKSIIIMSCLALHVLGTAGQVFLAYLAFRQYHIKMFNPWQF